MPLPTQSRLLPPASASASPAASVVAAAAPPLLPYAELVVATGHFGAPRKLGEGGFGAVYLASALPALRGVDCCAVKRLHDGGGGSASGQGLRELRTEVDILGDGKRVKGMHPIVFHLCAIAGVAHFALSFMAIAATTLGNSAVKAVITAIYAVWVACILILQYTHPWTGSPPETFFEMPAPLVFVIGTLVMLGYFLDTDKPKKA